jgi:hypothetical protein
LTYQWFFEDTLPSLAMAAGIEWEEFHEDNQSSSSKRVEINPMGVSGTR